MTLQRESNDRRAPHPRFTHPLYGSNIKTLCTVLARHGPVVSTRARARIGVAFISALLRSPFTWIERGWVAATRRRQPSLEPPVFIVGHWRSGTTHLFNILAQDRRFGYVSPVSAGLPWDFLILGRLLRPFLERAIPLDRVIDNIPVTPDSPQEDEIALAGMSPQSFFHGLFFPGHLRAIIEKHVFFEDCSDEEIHAWSDTLLYFMGKIARTQPGRRLLIKNPVYTARISLLHHLFPDARFIHIHRHPAEVYRSTQGFYRKLLPWLALQPFRLAEIDEIILDTYTRMMKKVAEDSGRLPPGSFCEMSFDDLERDPIPLLDAAYESLELGDFGEVKPSFEKYLKSISGYEKNVYSQVASDAEEVSRKAHFVFEHWGYKTRN